MAVVSVSLPDELVGEMDAAIARGPYRGRSEFVRAAVRDHLQERHPPAGGHVHGSVTVVYPHDKEARISEVRHAFHDVVLSLMHTHCEAETCMDVLIVGGPPARLHALQSTLERMRDVQRSRLVVVA
jgi:CopG family transcriptional regulator, nickel-responsive regulator